MVDSNLHRERISYSEKAFAYKLKNDVLKRKSGRKKSQVDHKTPRKRAIEIISEDCGDSPKQVQRYISLTKLIPEMLQELPGAGQFIIVMDTWFERLMAE